MPRLTELKQRSILDSFAKCKQYKAAAKIEKVDWRTVKRLVVTRLKKDNVPAQQSLAINSMPQQQVRVVDRLPLVQQYGNQMKELERRLVECQAQFKQIRDDIHRAETYRTLLKAEIATLKDRRNQYELECRNLERKRVAVLDNILTERSKKYRGGPQRRLNRFQVPPSKTMAKAISAFQSWQRRGYIRTA